MWILCCVETKHTSQGKINLTPHTYARTHTCTHIHIHKQEPRLKNRRLDFLTSRWCDSLEQQHLLSSLKKTEKQSNFVHRGINNKHTLQQTAVKTRNNNKQQFLEYDQFSSTSTNLLSVSFFNLLTSFIQFFFCFVLFFWLTLKLIF